MRRIFFLLLLGNAALLAWELRHLEPPAAPSAAAPAGDERSYVNRLLLLSEVDPGELRERAPLIATMPEPVAGAAAQPAGADVSAGEAEPLAALCFSVGPVESPAEVAVLDGWLSGLGASTRVRVGERREIALYWIYFPPLATRADAVARVEAMRAEGIDDIYIIPRGDMANAISLGVYSRRRSLDRRLTELRDKGYEPSIAPRYRTRKASWIDAAVRAPFEFPRAEFTARFPTTDYLAVPCRPEQIAALRALPPKPSPETGPASAPGDGTGTEHEGRPERAPDAQGTHEAEPADHRPGGPVQAPREGEAGGPAPPYLRSGLPGGASAGAAPPAASPLQGADGAGAGPPAAPPRSERAEESRSRPAGEATSASDPIDPVH